MPSRPLPIEDLRHIAHHAREAFMALDGARILVTGGTGFFGHWLLESLLYANEHLRIHVRATVVTRNAAEFRAKAPHIALNTSIHLLEGDIRSFKFPADQHTHVLHAAADSGGRQHERPAYELAESILDGTRHVLEFARTSGARRLLYISSGAVYGRATSLLTTPETYVGGPDPLLLQSAYDEAKRMAEHLCISHAAGTLTKPVIARCFAFVGPHLPLDRHFAIGNFIGAALQDKSIRIHGDGTPRRSWLYAADLAIWLWTMLVKGLPNRAYNVGSDDGMTISDAAHLTVATLRPGLPIQIDGIPNPGASLNSYVPAITRAEKELGLRVTVPLAEGLRRTAAWHLGND